MTGQSPVIKLRLVSGLLPGVYQEVMNPGKPDRARPSHPGLGISGEPRPREARSKKGKDTVRLHRARQCHRRHWLMVKIM